MLPSIITLTFGVGVAHALPKSTSDWRSRPYQRPSYIGITGNAEAIKYRSFDYVIAGGGESALLSLAKEY